jgi:iron complex outermembrane receptor protein
VLENSSGRSVDQNIGATQRRGLELSLDATFAGGFSSRLAYTYTRAVVEQSYYTCIAAPCNPLPALSNPATPLPATYRFVGAGSYLPAVPMNYLYAGTTWAYAPSGFSTTLEVESRARIYADDRNSAAAPSYWLANLRAGFEQEFKHWRLQEYARLDNLMNRAYVGTVIVNETNMRFFEPAPGRTAYIMFNASLRE